jgi:long-chain acyl-CoA synthetase
LFLKTDKNEYANNIAVITPDGSKYSYSAIYTSIQELAKYIEPRSLIFNLSQNTIGSLLGYLTCIKNDIVPLMLDNGLDNELLYNLVQTYQPEYIWLPQNKNLSFCNSKSIVTMFGYSLLKISSTKSYDLHDDLALLLTTSGSTGSPKLVKLTLQNISSNAVSIAKYLSIDESERPITALPMNYSFGLSIINSHLSKGATILLTPNSLLEKEFWIFLKSHKATSLSGIPYSYEILNKLRFFKMDLPHLTTLTQAGGKLNDNLNQLFAEYCIKNDKRFFVMYGQTEATARMSYLPPEKSVIKLGSMGVAIPGGAFSIVDDIGNTLEGADAIGELVYRGKNVSMGYAECLADLARGDENKGLLKTGDIARRDDDGFYYIVGRKKRFIKLFGNRVNLDEAERLLKNITPDCACTGKDDLLMIYITDPDMKDEIRSYMSQKTGINSRGFRVIAIDKIPKNSSGKTIYSNLGAV